MNRNDETFMREALAEALIALEHGEMPVGCVIVRDGVVIARAHNEREALNDPTAHAEILAIRAAAAALGDWRLDDCNLYVTLEPCPMCAGAISQARIRSLTYAAYDEHYGCAGSVYRIPEDPAFGTFCKSVGGLLANESKSLIEAFFSARRNV